MNVVVTGASGLIGTRLLQMLREKGHSVEGVSLRKDVDWEKKVENADAVVNLAGEPIFGQRWNTYVKAEIHDSRVNGTRRVVEVMGRARKKHPEKKLTLVNASAIGFYGSTEDDILTEKSEAGADFLAFVCRAWEDEADKARLLHGIRTVVLRTGIVLDKKGGALEKMLPFFKLGLGGPIGNGRQWMSWIHIDDLCGLIVHALENENVAGAVNGTAPNPVRNIDFSRTLGAVLNRPAFLPIPAPALYLRFGESSSILTGGQRVLPEAAVKSGYRFKYAALNEALQAALRG